MRYLMIVIGFLLLNIQSKAQAFLLGKTEKEIKTYFTDID